jgi:hypothetical protein
MCLARLPLQPAGKPGIGDVVEAAFRLRPEVDFSHLAIQIQQRVCPRPDDEVLILPRLLRAPLLHHPGKVLEDADLLVVPAGRAQHRNLHLAMLALEAEVILRVVREPASPM